MPRLYGAPAYARPPRLMLSERPFDPDDLPLEADRTASDRAYLAGLSGSGDDPLDSERRPVRRGLLPFGRRDRETADSRS
jgi:hypothetical protein